jgi:hypothetical protein
VECAREIGVPDIIDRCNLTVLLEPGQEGLVDFLARHRVRVAASLPCYSAANVDEQRGGGVFQRSIKVTIALCVLRHIGPMWIFVTAALQPVASALRVCVRDASER